MNLYFFMADDQASNPSTSAPFKQKPPQTSWFVGVDCIFWAFGVQFLPKLKPPEREPER